MKQDYLFRSLARAVEHYHVTRNNERYAQVFAGVCKKLERLEKELPKGGGIDAGCRLDLEKSSARKLVIEFSFHHIDENGCYDGWTDHTAIVTPSLTNLFDLKITGRNRNDVKDYVTEVFESCLSKLVETY